MNNSIVNYEPSGSSVTPSLIILNQTRSADVVIRRLSGSHLLKAEMGKTLKDALPAAGVVAVITAITSCILLANFLGVVAKFFQMVEVLINLSFLNSKLGRLIDFVVAILSELKFPLKIPSGFFWPGYKRAADELFWKSRFKITLYEKQLFILCNEMLVVILYLLSWVVWLVLLGIDRWCGGVGGSAEGSMNPAKKKAIETLRVKKMTPQALRSWIQNGRDPSRKRLAKKASQGGISDGKNGLYGLSRKEIDGALDKEKKLSKIEKEFEKNQNLNKQKIENAKKINQENKKIEKIPIKKSYLKLAIYYSRRVKELLFNFGYFDIQFVAFNELLHSDASFFDKLYSNASLSYFLSFLCLILINLDFIWILRRCNKLIKKIKKEKEVKLNREEEADKEVFFDDIEVRQELSVPVLGFNMIWMVKFSIFQGIVASLQTLPAIQCGIIFILQVFFFVYYVIKCKKEKFFSDYFAVTKFMIFEIAILVFSFQSFILSFEKSLSWFSEQNLGWLQILGGIMVLVALFVEFVTLWMKIIKNVFGVLKKKCCQKRRKRVFW